MNAGISVNADTAKYVGEKMLTSLAQQKVLQHSFKKKYQAVTLSTSAVKVNNETIQIDPQQLFQRLVTAGTRNDQLEEIFQFELCSYPPAIFEARYPRKMVLMNAAQEEEHAQQWISHGIWS